MRAHRIAWLVVAGCGRIAFDELDAGVGDGPVDTRPFACPDAYIAVPGDASLGTANFCAMLYEARARDSTTMMLAATGCDAGCNPNSLVTTHVPVASPSAVPWNSLDAINAKQLCKNLGAGFDLMSNREWMTLARDAERVAGNWSGGAVGSGRLVEGNTDTITGIGIITDTEDPYSDTGNSAAEPADAGWEQRRTLLLSTGGVIWDLPGNFQEWIDWTLGDPIDGPPTPCTGAEVNAFSCPGIIDDDFKPFTSTLDSMTGGGYVIGGSGNASRRGGQGGDKSMRIAGIYALNMNRNTTDVFPGTSFRCVFRP